MTQQITEWRPDTCECIIRLHWDDSVPNVFTPEVVSKCPAHAALSDTDCADQVQTENNHKNFTLKEAQAINPAITVDDYTWSFDSKRNLVVDFKGKLSAAQKIQALTNGRKAITLFSGRTVRTIMV